MDGSSSQLQHHKQHQRGPISSHPHPHHYERRRKSDEGFPKGSIVEVKTDDEEFKGVYFVATVLKSSSTTPSSSSPKLKNKRKLNQLFVEYHNLLAREGSLALLREYVNVSFVRPAPPPQVFVTGFEENDNVDAFYKDGWWIGVVKKPVFYEGGETRYIVSFEYPPDEREFGIEELRVHWDWVNQTWVQPEKQSVAATMFAVGRKAEVAFDREDCLDAWFQATILEDLGDGDFMVESDIIPAWEDHKATIDSRHIRPCPPRLKDKNFVLLEKVDADLGSGWWTGVITKELEENKYNVYFKHLKMEKELHESVLRPHMEWKDGKWFISQLSQDIVLPPEDALPEQVSPENVDGEAVAGPVNGSPNKNNTSDVDTNLTKRRHSLSDPQAAISKPLKRHKEGHMVGASKEGTHDASVEEMLNGSPSPVTDNATTNSAAQTATVDLSSSGHFRGKKNRTQRKIVITQNGGNKVNFTSSSVKKSTQLLQGESAHTDIGDVEGIIAENVQNGNAIKETELPIIIGLPCMEKGSSEVQRSRDKKDHTSNSIEIVTDMQQQQNDSALQITKDDELSPVAGEAGTKRKRGRPRKTSISSPPLTVNVGTADVASDALPIQSSDSLISPEVIETGSKRAFFSETLSTYKTKSRSTLRNRKGSTRKRSISKMHDKVVKQSVRVQPERSPSNGSDQISPENVAPEVEANAIVEQSTRSSQNLQSEIFEFTEDMTQPIAIEEPLAMITDLDSVDQSEKQDLPFEKNTALWKTIESMDVFRKIPQSPHFKPLKDFPEASREGLAIGYMVTYSTVVEKISKLQPRDTEGISSDILDILTDLEKHGFIVSFVRDRINRFIAVKDKQIKLADEANELKSQISVQNSEKSKIEEEISEINEQFMKLKEKLSVAESAKEMKDTEIDVLQAKLLETEESIKNLKL